MAIQAGGTTQEAGVNQEVPIPPAVIVRDQSSNPVPGVSVSFEVTAGDGSVDPATVVTGSDGIAAVDGWTLGPSAGTNTLVASIPSVPAAGTETFDATATAPNGAPTAANDNLSAYTVDEDETLSITNQPNSVLANDTDPEDDPLTAINVSNPPDGSVTLNSDGTFTYTPDPDFNGTDTFTYQASDGSASSNAATVTITVTPVNDPPTFQVGPDQEVSSLGGPVSVAGWATASPGPGNESSQTVNYQVTTTNDGAFAALPAVASDGTLTFTPALTLVQVVVTVTVEALDSEGASGGSQNFTITINL